MRSKLISMERQYPTRPIVGVGILVKRDEEYLLIKRGSEPDKGMWTIPGGLVEIGETVREAAARETREETGLEVEVKDILDVLDKIALDDMNRVRYHFIVVYFLAVPSTGEVKPSSDALDAKWLRSHELTNYSLTESFKVLLEHIGLAHYL